MHNSSSKDSQRLVGYSKRGITIDCSNLRVNDLIIIRTQNNLYRFLITDPQALRGRLIGEWRKIHFPEAILIGARIHIGGQRCTLNARLQTSAQALFYVQQGKEKLQLTTSTILALGWFINREE